MPRASARASRRHFLPCATWSDTLLPSGEARVTATVCDNGLDIDIERTLGKLRPFTSAHGKAAEAAGIIRLTAGGDPLFSIAPPRITLAGVAVELPPGAFLQASSEAEAAMTAIAMEALGKARKVADLFSGLGTFSFAMARRASVTAVENDRPLLLAMDAAARRAEGIEADPRTRPRPDPRAAVRRRTQCVRCRAVGSAPSRCAGSGERAGEIARAEGHRHVL